MTDQALKAAVERPDWPITEHGVATFAEIEQAIVTLAADDAVLAYRLQGFVAQSLAALSSQASVMDEMADGLSCFFAVNDEFERRAKNGIADAIEPLAGVTRKSTAELRVDGVNAMTDLRTALSQYRTLGGE